MVYVIVAVIAVVLLIPLAYELPNYVYGRKYAVLDFLRWRTSIYITLFLLLLTVLIADGFFMIRVTSKITLFSARIWLGIVAGFVGLLYFPRLIPIYYDEGFDVRSASSALGVFVRELIAIWIFTAALTAVSVFWWSFVLDGIFGAGLTAMRLRRFVKHRKGK
ncbi:MAG: hypothetical protein HFK08_02705 [Clostridia bacterium]|nr:hypothetical protein [Clostridia bacterium]